MPSIWLEISDQGCLPTLLGMGMRSGRQATTISGYVLVAGYSFKFLIGVQVPMIAPFCGCTFGAWLYDVLIFTGESPVNTPWMGMKRVVRPDWKAVKKELSWYPDQEKEV